MTENVNLKQQRIKTTTKKKIKYWPLRLIHYTKCIQMKTNTLKNNNNNNEEEITNWWHQTLLQNKGHIMDEKRPKWERKNSFMANSSDKQWELQRKWRERVCTKPIVLLKRLKLCKSKGSKEMENWAEVDIFVLGPKCV